jgi:hypothetical protein
VGHCISLYWDNRVKGIFGLDGNATVVRGKPSHAPEEVGGVVWGGGFGFFGGEVVLDFGEHGGAHGF